VEAIPDEYEDLLYRESCDEDELCVPKHVGMNPTGFGADLVHCESWGGGEGRCLSICMRAVMDVMTMLKPDSEDYEDGCEFGFMCAPCVNPITGETTGACTLAGDAPTEPSYQFQKCCLQGEISRGTCVPGALVPEATLESLLVDLAPEDVCDVEGQIDEDFVCAPTELAIDPDLIQPSNCLVTLPFYGELEGLCLADCFKPEEHSSRDLQGNCEDTNDECLPCDLGAPCESQE